MAEYCWEYGNPMREDSPVLLKQTDDMKKIHDFDCTPGLVSPFLPGSREIKPELKDRTKDILWPTHNRASRRANGQVKPRKRIRGQLPPHPLAVINRAHRIERQQIKMLKQMDANVTLTYDEAELAENEAAQEIW